MIVPFRRFLLAACLGSVTAALAQIPPQTARPTNPNAVPPSGAGGFNRPRPAAAGQRPGTANAADGEERTAIRPEDAIKPSGGVELQFPNTPLSQILLVYEDLTGLKIIRDAAAEQATVSIETTGELPKDRAIMFIEKSLLLNGYSFVPAGEGMVKLLTEGKKPQTEGAPLFESAADLPETDQVVSFVVLLKYLNPEDAVKAIDQIIPRHSYGVLVPVPNAKALIIVENSNTIRSILELLERLDVKPGATVTKRIQLVRSDAEDVKKALDEILGLDEKDGNSNAPNARPNNAIQPAGGAPQPQLAPLPSAVTGSTAAEVKPKILAIPRTNRLLVIAMSETAAYIETLVEELDSASELRTFVSRTLKYLDVESAMGIIGDAISRTEGDDSGSGSGGVNSLGQSNSSSNNRTNTSSTGSSGLFGNNGSNSSGFGSNSNSNSNSGSSFGNSSGFGSSSGTGSGVGSGGSNAQPLRPNNGPRSIVIGKTLLISDPTANSLFASGPPEHLRVLNEILDELDKRPQQILISAIIGEVQLGDSDSFGVQALFRGRRNANGTTASGGIASTAGNPSGGLLDARSAVALTDLAKASAGTAFSFYGGIRGGLDIIVNAFNNDTRSRVISRPTIFTLNNTPAVISSGTSFPYASSSQNLGTAGGLVSNVQYQDVALSLSITPLINSDDELTLQIVQENSDIGKERPIGEDNYPELSKQMLNTVVMCKNNSTIMLGGLIRDSNTNSTSNIPLISRIPGLDWLTKSRSNTKDRRELLIFIHPRIVEGMHDLPPSVNDGPGSSPAAREFMEFVDDEKRAAADAAKASLNPVKRNRIKTLVDKLFGRSESDIERPRVSSYQN